MKRILILGKNADYHLIDFNEEKLKKIMPFSSSESEEQLLFRLATKETIYGRELRNYGAPIEVIETTDSKETLIKTFERFFQKIEDYQNAHKADYILIQNIKIRHGRISEIRGLAQMLLKDFRNY